MASILLVGFWIIASFFILLSAVILTLSAKVSQAFEDLLLYGKVRTEQRKWSVVQLIEVPKRWFTHFYVVGSIVNSFMFLLILFSYSTSSALPFVIEVSIDLLCIGLKQHVVNTDELSCMLLVSLMAVQNIRRLLECLLVSVYSPRGTMNVLHYILGIVFYFSFSLAVLCESPDPAEVGSRSLLDAFGWRHVVGVMLFSWASWHHHFAHVTLARLRTSKKGKVVSYEHAIPRGGLFEYISCPHYLMEIVIYLAFLLIAGYSHVTLLSVVIFVVTNQLVVGYLTHRWYRDHFGSLYPIQRKAIIPLLL